MHLLGRSSLHLYQPHNYFVAQFGFLQSQNADIRIVDTHQAEATPKRSFVLSGLERDQRRAQPVGLPVRLALAPIAGVAGNAEDVLMVSPVLVELIGVTARHPSSRTRRAQQR